MTDADVVASPRFAATREALRAVACYVVAPARRAETGRIGLRPLGEGFATPPLPDSTRICVEGDELVRRDGARTPFTTLRDAAAFVGVELSEDPGVGHDLPTLEPDAPLEVDREASLALGRYYAFGQRVLGSVADLPGIDAEPAQLWPEHFDLATVVHLGAGDDRTSVNVGASPGDDGDREPYLYVGPHDTAGLDDPYWDRPFGAALGYASVVSAPDPLGAAVAFVVRGLTLLRR